MAVHCAPRTYFCIKNGLVLPNYHDLQVHLHRLETGIHCFKKRRNDAINSPNAFEGSTPTPRGAARARWGPLLGATFPATPVAVAGSLVGGLFGPPGVLLYGLIPYLLLVGIPRLIGVVWTRHGS